MNDSIGVSTTADSKRKRSGSSGAPGKLWEEAGKNQRDLETEIMIIINSCLTLNLRLS